MLGGRNRGQMKIKFPKNLDKTGRLIRLALGILLFIYAVWKMSWIALLAALFVCFESLMSWCVIYQILGKNSCGVSRKNRHK